MYAEGGWNLMILGDPSMSSQDMILQLPQVAGKTG